jgi:hypothetical protein
VIPDAANRQWLPDMVLPRQSVAVQVLPGVPKENVVVISVHALARAGLDVRQVSSVSLGTQGTAGSQINLSPLFHLARDDSFIADEEPNQFLSSVQEHSSGLVTFTKTRTERTRAEIINGLHENSIVN